MPYGNKANKPVVKKMKMEAKAASKSLKTGLKAVKKSNKVAVKSGQPSMTSKKSK